MSFSHRTFSDLLNDLLTDLLNQDPSADVSQGSLFYMKSSATAAMLWGLYQRVNYQGAQIFPDTSDRANLEHYATLRGLSLIPGETTAALLERVLLRIRRPPAGGNRYDYRRWVLEVATTANAWVVPLGQGVGTLDIIVLANAVLTGSEIPDAALLASVRAHLVDICPNDIKYLRVLAPEILLQDVTIYRSGATYPAAAALADLTLYLNAFEPGEALYLDQLKALTLGGSAGAAPVTLPAANVLPTPYQMIRPGVLDVL